jgi:hypothetical protein
MKVKDLRKKHTQQSVDVLPCIKLNNQSSLTPSQKHVKEYKLAVSTNFYKINIIRKEIYKNVPSNKRRVAKRNVFYKNICLM